MKNFQVLSEFFSTQVSDIAISINNLAGLVKKAKDAAEGSGVQKIDDLKRHVQELQQTIQRKDGIVEPEITADGPAEGRIIIENHNAAVIIGQPQLRLGTDHSR